jgi:hypothetical protein
MVITVNEFNTEYKYDNDDTDDPLIRLGDNNGLI